MLYSPQSQVPLQGQWTFGTGCLSSSHTVCDSFSSRVVSGFGSTISSVVGNNKWGNYPCGPFWTPWFINHPNSAKTCACLVQTLGKVETVSELQSESIGVGSVYREWLTSYLLLENMAWEYLSVPSWPSHGLVWWKMVEGRLCCLHAGWHVWLSRVEGAQCLPAKSSAGCVLVGTLVQPLRHFKSDWCYGATVPPFG